MAVRSPSFEKSTGDVAKVGGNLVPMQRSFLEANNFHEYDTALTLHRQAADIVRQALTLSDFARLAVDMETANDRELVRWTVRRYAESFLGESELVIKVTTKILTFSRYPALVAEGRALRDEVERLKAILAPCAAS